MRNIKLVYKGLAAQHPNLIGRKILDLPAEAYLARELKAFGATDHQDMSKWTVELGDHLLFDRAGLGLIAKSLASYQGLAAEIKFDLRLDPDTYRNYYCLQLDRHDHELSLPIVARRTGARFSGAATIVVDLPAIRTPLDFPVALRPTENGSLPTALLLPMQSEFDLLFASQIALTTDLVIKIKKSPLTWVKAALSRRPGGFKKKASILYRNIHPTADVHPTAVIEGSTIGPGARVGAHCVVRYSVIGESARLHDGAKVEFSVVGRHSWLMHDLVLYRSLVEDQVFLIHGPYQFSYFQSSSAAFATIMMDYRPDGSPIKVKTEQGLKSYYGPFLGSVLQSGSKTLGGSLLAPGRIVPGNTWLSCSPDAIHFVTGKESGIGHLRPVFPASVQQ